MKKYELTTECSTMENKDCNIKADIRPQKRMLKVSTSNQLSQARFTCRRRHTELIAKVKNTLFIQKITSERTVLTIFLYIWCHFCEFLMTDVKSVKPHNDNNSILL